MNDDTRHQIALARYKLISPVLAEPTRSQNCYFRAQAELEHIFPHFGRRRVQVPTFKRWLRLYREGGFEELKPKQRLDRGRPRRMGKEEMAAVVGKCRAFPNWTARRLYESLLADGQLGTPPVSYNSLLRIIRVDGLRPKRGRTDARKRYEVENINDLWVCDFMHGPLVKTGKRTAKSILCAIIDDHSRVIVGASFNAHETISALTCVLKEAMLAYGMPLRLYTDNGPAFSSDQLAHSCALAGMALIHSKPYDSPSRGKIERFFRTVRDRFLPGLCKDPTLDEVNEAFAIWLSTDYHNRHHAGIDQKPIDRYNASTGRTHVRRLSRAELDQIFLVRHERVVNNDATISFKGAVYEVPAAYIRQRVEIRHPVDDAEDIALFDNGARIANLKRVDVHENARTFRPHKANEVVSFAKREVQS